MAHDAMDFHVEEFKQIKSEVSALLIRIETLIKFALFGGAAIYAWVLTTFPGDVVTHSTGKNIMLVELAMCLPPALLIFAASLCWLSYVHINIMAEYLRRLEGLLGYACYGWEKHWAPKTRYATGALIFFFVALLAVEVGITAYLICAI